MQSLRFVRRWSTLAQKIKTPPKPVEPPNENPPWAAAGHGQRAAALTHRAFCRRLLMKRIILSDGSSFTVASTSPKPFVQLSKDTRNNPLWNPLVGETEDNSGKMALFSSRFAIDTNTSGIQGTSGDGNFLPDSSAPPARAKTRS
ncbi:hypothetical protein DFJ74DRAFT_666035 [Hyaloraphidium curvatum]|nr:hypothetical protein DFJ74DRAFT_666035 [Hyaloraphidium curvatum]